jgi:phenylacetic acid degradation operon negative regulatory protein
MDHAPRHLILTLFGLHAREEGNWLSVASVVSLMADLSVDSAAVRSSISRLKKRGVLVAEPRGGQAGYALSPASLELLREGDRRIWMPRAEPGDGWLVLLFSVPESMRERRHSLRSLLGRLGFGSAAPGAWVAPATLYDETVRALGRAGLLDYTELFRGEHLGIVPIADRVAQWWDLDALATAHREFADTWREMTRRRTWSDADAFAAYVPMLTAWRRLPYLDPGLPLATLPDQWPGAEAEDLFRALDARLREPAHAHAVSVIEA